MIDVDVKILPNGESLSLPEYQTPFSSGADLIAAVETDLIIKPMIPSLVPTGIAIALPIGYEGQLRPRSGLALKYCITLLNSPGTIDADYRGEIMVILMNFGKSDFVVTRGMRIAQLIIVKTEQINWIKKNVLEPSVRNEGGFGSTGQN